MKTKLIFSIFLLIGIFLFQEFSGNLNAATKSNIEKKSLIKTKTYSIPSRSIIVSPYFIYIYANNLYEGAIEDQSGLGGGLNIRTQIYKEFGFILDGFYTNLKPIEQESLLIEEENDQDFVAACTGGFYYSIFYYSLTDIRFDLCYGAIIAGSNVMTLFMPGVEFYRKVTDRIIIFAKLAYPITNDWFVDSGYDEHYTSFSASCGFSVVF